MVDAGHKPARRRRPTDDEEAGAMLEQVSDFVLTPDQLRAAIRRVEVYDGYAFVVALQGDGGTILTVEADNGG
jgi:hypothetical protein